MHSPSEQDYIQQLSIDCVIFGYQQQQLSVLIPKLHFKGDFWALPSGFVYQTESIDEAAHRILEGRTGIRNIYMEQFRVFGKTERSSRQFMDQLVQLNEEMALLQELQQKEYDWITRRFVSIGYYALVDINQVKPQRHDIDESIDWYPVKQLPPLIMDHAEIVQEALYTLRRDLDTRLNAYNLLPETFTMKEVQQLYEAIFDKPFAANNFPRKILEQNILERLEKRYTGAANKAPYLYRLRNHSPANEPRP
ncbi:NUDIX domain-containing protein [Rudanella paleaurantiibacter]|uniref:NUDIX domain-containing protein n=1 Tax=Rudanella paleaurantiibacter TaxID=2614655 RepID=A0A7J5TY70_9BACT|nr:NUDIX domain-containing protein [Rudanella paleaurantiibacter]KAB7730089.1 NUDIX domain-containing protein [Rudanella paleaurantiibacter]